MASDLLTRTNTVMEIDMDTGKNTGTVASTPTMTSTGTKKGSRMGKEGMTVMENMAAVATTAMVGPGEGEA